MSVVIFEKCGFRKIELCYWFEAVAEIVWVVHGSFATILESTVSDTAAYLHVGYLVFELNSVTST